MRQALFALAAALCAEAGTITGVVLEHTSNRPLARTLVRLEPVPDARAGKLETFTLRSGRSGQFAFPAVAPGMYFLTAVRGGYFPAAYGQRLPAGRGTPIEVTKDSNLFAELRARHKGALTGRVLDENGVGVAGVPVLAYRARLPLRSSGSASSDDRGVFRIHSLEPGKYWVRSGGHTLEDGSGWLPTFGPQTHETREARVHAVTVDTETAYADVSPESGGLFSLGGDITCDTPGVVLVTLSSETGQQRSQTMCGPGPGAYRFSGLPSGTYEVFAALQSGSSAGFVELLLQRDTLANLSLQSNPRVEIETVRSGAGSAAEIPVKLIGRRHDLSETGAAADITGKHAVLAPGYWEFRAQPPPGYYVESISNVRSNFRRSRKGERPASDWFEVLIEPQLATKIRVTVSDQAAQISGIVMAERKVVAGAPVFLWPVAEPARRSLSGPAQMISDTEGRFRFDSLPPGDYRILASFDVSEIDEEIAEASRAPVIHAEPSRNVTLEVPIWIAP
jgi:hypothetical protein